MSTFATGKYAHGFCDRCGFRYDLHELKDQIIDQRSSGLLVCPECMDIDHEQLRLGKFRIFDPEALRHTRPDLSLYSSRQLTGIIWPPEDRLRLTPKAPTVVIS